MSATTTRRKRRPRQYEGRRYGSSPTSSERPPRSGRCTAKWWRHGRSNGGVSHGSYTTACCRTCVR